MTQTQQEQERLFGFDHTQQYPQSPVTDDTGRVVSAVDWLGNRFGLGEKVLYCISAGRGQMMAVGQVMQIRSEEKMGGRYRYARVGEAPDFVREYDNQSFAFVRLRETYHEITVQIRTLKTSGTWNNKARTSAAWVNPMNITALPVETT